MQVSAQHVSAMRDSTTWCRPSDGYIATIMVELEDYDLHIKGIGQLPDSDEQWPKGAPLISYIWYGDSIYKQR